MTTRLTPEQETAINGLLRSGEYLITPANLIRAAYGVHVGTLLAEIDVLREIVEQKSEACSHQLDIIDATLDALEDAGAPEPPETWMLRADQTMIWRISMLKWRIQDARAGVTRAESVSPPGTES